MGRGEERESKGQRGGNIFPSDLPSFPPLFSPPHVKDKPGGVVVWPSDCVRRLAVPHTGTPLITGAGPSLLDTKTPHTAAYTCTCEHTNMMNTCVTACARERGVGGGGGGFLSVFTEVHVIISKMFWQRAARGETEKGMPNSLESHQESGLELV